jgi:hypothetical protein
MSQPTEQHQPAPHHAVNALQQEVARLRAENARLADNGVYLLAVLSEKEEIIGSLLEQISKDAPAPTQEKAEE